MEFISGFIGTYLPLTEDEEEQFEDVLESMELETKERVMQFVTDWEQKGCEQGREEGFQEGFQEARQGDIIRILEIRFEEISGELKKKIGKIEDLKVLETLLVQAVTSQSAEAFLSVAEEVFKSNNPETNLVKGDTLGDRNNGEN